MKNNVTYLEDLPTLDEMGDNEGNVYDINQRPNMSKFIRPKQVIHQDSGMYSNNIPVYNEEEQITNRRIEDNRMYSDMNCIDVHSHIQSCPICSKFFKNDSSIYIIIIVILVVICILLTKKHLKL